MENDKINAKVEFFIDPTQMLREEVEFLLKEKCACADVFCDYLFVWLCLFYGLSGWTKREMNITAKNGIDLFVSRKEKPESLFKKQKMEYTKEAIKRK
jgi:hypothetical protein